MKKSKNDEFYKKVEVCTPNTRLYSVLLAVLSVVVVIIFIILCLKIESESYVTISSALISILGGAFASVGTAWLIDIFQCKRKNEYLIKECMDSISYLHLTLDELFQSFANNCYSKEDNNEPQHWEYWIEYLEKKNFYRNEKDIYNRMLSVYVNLNTIISETDILCNGELRKCTETIYGDLTEFYLLSTACKQLCELIFNDKNENLSFIIFKIRDVLSTIVGFWDIAEKVYIPYNMNSYNTKKHERNK